MVRWSEFPDKELIGIIINEIKHIGIAHDPKSMEYIKLYRRGIAPSVSYIKRRYGTWKEFIENHTDFNLSNNYWSLYTDDEILSIFKKTMLESGSIGLDDYEKISAIYNAPASYTMINRFGSWNKVMLSADIKINGEVAYWESLGREITLKIIYDELIRIGLLTNPTKKEYTARHDNNNTPGRATIETIFGGWKNLLNELKEINVDNILTIDNANVWDNYTDEELLHIISSEIKRLSLSKNISLPHYRSNHINGKTPSPTTIFKRFGSWNNTLSLIDKSKKVA